VNIGSLITKTAQIWPCQIAVDDGSMALTYGEFVTRAAAFADGLRRCGYQTGDRVVVFMPNRSEYLLALFGLFKGGFVAVPVNVKLHPVELGYILDHCAARGVICSSSSNAVVETAVASIGGTFDKITVDGSGDPNLATIVRSGDPATADAEVQPDDVAWIFYTSGTTGQPKGAMLTHRNLCAMTMNCLADMLDFGPEDVSLHVAPLSHGSGLYALPALARGGKSIVYAKPSFNPAEVLQLMDRERVTIIPFLAPTMIHMLLEADPGLRLPAFRRAVYGGAPIDSKLAEAAIERFGPVFVQLYGQGESPMTISRLRPEDHAGPRLHSAGTVRTDVEVRLVNNDDVPVPYGDEGEVCVRGDVVMKGYWNDQPASTRTLRGGWLHTGDIGRFEDGYLYLLSRRNDVIISGGSNIYPQEVENALLAHPAVHEACVFGEPDPRWGEAVVAAVVVTAAVSIPELQNLCRAQIASYKKPKRIEFVESLPKNAYGKVLRQAVRDRLAAHK
jgi:Acyl-CoA synthetases (AMP-forming)/AMP-acid ligases II